MLKPELQQKLTQKLSPQQIQVIKLLELNTLQLEQRIKNEIEENPALDDGSESEDDEFSMDVDDNNTDESVNESMDEQEFEENTDPDDEFSAEDYMEDDDDEIPDYRLNINNTSKDDKFEEVPYSEAKSFQEVLGEQFMLKDVTERQKLIATFIIGSIDDDGYLRRDLDAIVDDIDFKQNVQVSEDEIKVVLSIVQELDPAGIAARDLQECLVLQLDRKENQTPVVKLAKNIIHDCFDEFTKKHYSKITARLGISDDELKDAIDVIVKLNPKPGVSYDEPQNRMNVQTIFPDFNVEIEGGKLVVTLNGRNSVELQISKSFENMMQKYSTKTDKQSREAMTFVRQRVDSAKWFIDALEQRRRTLINTMAAIVDFQHDFFMTGDDAMLKPMILKDIAEVTSLDISTVSRVVNSKYVSTPYGNFLLKYFFSEAMQTDSGEDVSTREIKKILQEVIDAEDSNSPLTDDRLSEILKDRGYLIARRTIAKYREQLNIPVARLRRKL